MANEILEGIARDIKDVDTAIAEAETLVEAMKEAGETVTDLETELRALSIRKVKWQKMLESRGITATPIKR